MPVEIGFSNTEIPSIAIACDGKPFALTVQLITLETSSFWDGTGAATLRVAAQPGDGDPAASLESAPLGGVLSIALGHVSALQPIFTGTLQAHRICISSAGLPELVLEAIATLAPPAMEDEAIVLVARYGESLLKLDARRSFGDPSSTASSAPPISLNGYAVVPGTTAAKPGTLLCVEGIGKLFEESVRVVAVHQSISLTRWTTRVDF